MTRLGDSSLHVEFPIVCIAGIWEASGDDGLAWLQREVGGGQQFCVHDHQESAVPGGDYGVEAFRFHDFNLQMVDPPRFINHLEIDVFEARSSDREAGNARARRFAGETASSLARGLLA